MFDAIGRCRAAAVAPGREPRGRRSDRRAHDAGGGGGADGRTKRRRAADARLAEGAAGDWPGLPPAALDLSEAEIASRRRNSLSAMTAELAPTPRTPASLAGRRAWGWLLRLAQAMFAALRATLVYGEAGRLCPPPLALQGPPAPRWPRPSRRGAPANGALRPRRAGLASPDRMPPRWHGQAARPAPSAAAARAEGGLRWKRRRAHSHRAARH
jgi:hypothetical protein